MHWFVEVVQHTTSPLTSALTIFGTYKASHLPKIRIWFRAKRILWSAAVRGSALHRPATGLATPHAARSASIRPLDVSGRRTLVSARVAVTAAEAPAWTLADGGLATLAETATAWLGPLMVTSPVTGSQVFWSVSQFEQLIASCHTTFGLPWWASILTTTLLFRIAVLPLNVSLVRNTARLYLIKPEITRLGEVMRHGAPLEQETAARDLMALFKRTRAHPLKNIVSPILFPAVFLSLFGSVHDLCTTMPALKTDGPAWFPDLSAVDSTGLLPVLSALTWLATIELASGAVFHMPAWMHLSSRIIAVAFIPVTQTLPSGIFIFWLTSNVFAATRAFVLRFPRVQRAVGIPPVRRTP